MISSKSSGKIADLFIYGDIGDTFFGGEISDKQVADELKKCASATELQIYLNSGGGSVIHGQAIYNQLLRFRAKKTVYIDGVAASIASLIALAGDEVVIASNARVMIHEPYAGAIGPAKELRRMADVLDGFRDAIITSYVERTKSSREQIDKWVAAETWMSADEAVRNGFATRVAAAGRQKVESRWMNSYRNTPEDYKQKPTDFRVALAAMGMRTRGIKRPN